MKHCIPSGNHTHKMFDFTQNLSRENKKAYNSFKTGGISVKMLLHEAGNQKQQK